MEPTFGPAVQTDRGTTEKDAEREIHLPSRRGGREIRCPKRKMGVENMNQQKLTEKGANMPKKEIDKYTFKICEAVKLGLDKFFIEENKPIKITEAHTDFAKRIIPTLPRGWMQQKHSWDACKR